MKKTYIIWAAIFLSFSFVANGQLKKPEKQFLTWFMKERQKPNDQILYLAKHDNKELLHVLKAYTLLDIWALSGPGKSQNKLILTKKEKKYIFKKLTKDSDQSWEDQLLPGSRLLSIDIVNYYLKDRGFG